MIDVCSFTTKRLYAVGWHLARLPLEVELAQVVAEMLTPAVTKALPPAWHGVYTIGRARSWIAERDSESYTLLVTERTSATPLGLLLLSKPPESSDAAEVDIRLGYLLAESAWGRGFAGELVGGLIGWCQTQSSVHSLTGGVDRGNEVSARVLTHNGFERQADAGVSRAEDIYTLVIKR